MIIEIAFIRHDGQADHVECINDAAMENKCCNADILHMAIASEKVDLENILGTF
jgi:hypothetical protein